MSTNSIIGLLVALLVIGGGAYLLLQNSGSDAMMKDDTMSTSTDTMMKDEQGDTMMKDETSMTDEAMMKTGSYEVYAPEKLALANSGDVVLFFRATWCPTCKAVDEDIRAHLSAIPSGLTILEIDYDNSTALKQKYGVTYQHTFVQVNADGTLIKKWSGSTTLVALLAEVQ